MIDFHCHLDLYSDPFSVADEAQRRGVGVLSVTTTPSAWPGTIGLAKGRSAIRTALGLHPELAGQRIRELPLFDKYLPQTRFVGEVGLDGSPQLRPFWPQQLEVFEHVLASCAKAGDKIVSIHSRRAATDVLDCLDRHERVNLPILHWFSGTQSERKRAVDRGCWFSVGPAMLASGKGRAHAQALPRDRVLLESDGPLTQVAKSPLLPWNIELALDELSRLWDVRIDEAAGVIEQNQIALLG